MNKKLPVFLLFLLFLLVPFYAKADTLQLYYSAPTSGSAVTIYGTTANWYLDYDAKLNDGPLDEVFCVDYQNGPGQGVSTTYTLSDIAPGTKYQAAANVAEYFYINYNTIASDPSDDRLKVAAQIIIWEIVFDYSNGFNFLADNFKSTYDKDFVNAFLSEVAGSNITTNNWKLAVNKDRQDYLVRIPGVPEPTQMLLFGTGLIALAGIGRKRFLKK